MSSWPVMTENRQTMRSARQWAPSAHELITASRVRMIKWRRRNVWSVQPSLDFDPFDAKRYRQEITHQRHASSDAFRSWMALNSVKSSREVGHATMPMTFCTEFAGRFLGNVIIGTSLVLRVLPISFSHKYIKTPDRQSLCRSV